MPASSQANEQRPILRTAFFDDDNLAVQGLKSGLENGIRIAIFEDDSMVIQGLSSNLLKNAIHVGEDNRIEVEVVGATQSQREFLELVTEHSPQAVFIDLMIDGDTTAGLETLREVKRRAPQIKCVVLTQMDDVVYFWEAIDAGADAFVSKKSYGTGAPPIREILGYALMGHGYYDPQMVRELVAHVDRASLPLMDSSPREESSLTPREFEILELIAKKYSNLEISERLMISENTVKTHVTRLLSKIDAASRHDAVWIARQRGLLPYDESESDE